MTDLQTLLAQGPVTLDGSMSTPLEAWGEDTNSDLWTARALQDNPDLVYRVHQEYFEAGARIAITDSYQASLQAFSRHGLSEEQARALIRKSAAV
ncbi:homocysteine S-methyltransferase family protein, partial [Lactobacillus nasalidis]